MLPLSQTTQSKYNFCRSFARLKKIINVSHQLDLTIVYINEHSFVPCLRTMLPKSTEITQYCSNPLPIRKKYVSLSVWLIVFKTNINRYRLLCFGGNSFKHFLLANENVQNQEATLWKNESMWFYSSWLVSDLSWNSTKNKVDRKRWQLITPLKITFTTA